MQNTINREENIDWNFESKLLEKWAFLSYLKKHRVDLASYAFGALFVLSYISQSNPNESEELNSTIQQTVDTQKTQVSNILNQSNWNIEISNQIISEPRHNNNNETQKEYIKPTELSINFQYDSTIYNAGEGNYDQETWVGFIRLNNEKIASLSQKYKVDPNIYAEVLYNNELWSIEFMHKIDHENFKLNYPDLYKKYYYNQLAEMLWEYKPLEKLEQNNTNEANHMFLLRIKEIIYSSWSQNQYAMISDIFSDVFHKVFTESDWNINYTEEGINQLLTQNYYGELSHTKITEFLDEIKDNLYSQWIYVDHILNQSNISTQIAQMTDYTK